MGHMLGRLKLRRGRLMGRRSALLIVATFVLAILASTAGAATDGPKAKGCYGSKQPDLSRTAPRSVISQAP
jgi:hypothetical protein